MLPIFFWLAIVVALIGFLVWLGEKVPIAQPWRQIAIGLLILGTVVWLIMVLFYGAPVPHFNMRTQ